MPKEFQALYMRLLKIENNIFFSLPTLLRVSVFLKKYVTDEYYRVN